MYRCRPASLEMELYRNARADELIFVHRGSGFDDHVRVLPFKPMDYIVIPKCTTYRLEFDQLQYPTPPLRSCRPIFGSRSVRRHRFPPRYLNQMASFDSEHHSGERDLHGPSSIHVIDSEAEVAVNIKNARTGHVM